MIKISNKITISNLDNSHKEKIKKYLTIPNANYAKMRKMGVWAKREFTYYEDIDGVLIVNRGLYNRVIGFMERLGEEYEVVEDLVNRELKDFLNPNFKLRNYQEKLVNDMLVHRQGILHASTGSGKTIIMLEVIHRLSKTATILVPNKSLLYQWHKELEDKFNYTAGIVGDGKKEIKGITISTYQSLYRDKELLKELVDSSSILISDEAHGAISPKNMEVVSSFRPTYLYGASATLKRTDKKDKVINFLFGDVIAKYLIDTLKPNCKIVKYNYNDHHIDKYPYTKIKDSREVYPLMLEHQINDEARNNLIIQQLKEQVAKGRKTLVLTKRIQHYKNIKKLLKDQIDKVYYISSENKDRNKLLKQFKDKTLDFNALFGTTSLLSVGVDIPVLDTLLISCDMKSEILHTQSCGRVLRLLNNKKTPLIIDIADISNGIFYSQIKARKELYNKMEWTVDNF